MRLDPTSLLHLLSLYGYPGLAALVLVAATGIPVPVPVAGLFIVLGMLTVNPHGPGFLATAALATVAAAGGHSVDYWLGRAGSPLLEKGLRRIERTLGGAIVMRAELGISRSSGLLIVLTRCILTAVASPVSALAGAMRIAFPLYLALELLGEAIYFAGYLALGRLLGSTLARSGLTLAVAWTVAAIVIIGPALLIRLRPRLVGRLMRAGLRALIVYTPREGDADA
jgi:membrane protein DedA with SNARE-associated domain